MPVEKPTLSIPSVEAGEILIKEITAQMNALQATQKLDKKRYANWRALTEEPVPVAPVTGGDAMGMSIMGMILQFLFGMPLFDGFGMAGEALKGVAQIGAMGAVEDDNPSLRYAAKLNESLNVVQFSKAMREAKTQAEQMAVMKQITTILMMGMMAGQAGKEEDTTSGDSSGGTALVTDVLRHPTLARFKQNRQSVSCIRTLFQRQVDAVTPHYAVPRVA